MENRERLLIGRTVWMLSSQGSACFSLKKIRDWGKVFEMIS